MFGMATQCVVKNFVSGRKCLFEVGIAVWIERGSQICFAETQSVPLSKGIWDVSEKEGPGRGRPGNITSINKGH